MVPCVLLCFCWEWDRCCCHVGNCLEEEIWETFFPCIKNAWFHFHQVVLKTTQCICFTWAGNFKVSLMDAFNNGVPFYEQKKNPWRNRSSGLSCCVSVCVGGVGWGGGGCSHEREGPAVVRRFTLRTWMGTFCTDIAHVLPPVVSLVYRAHAPARTRKQPYLFYNRVDTMIWPRSAAELLLLWEGGKKGGAHAAKGASSCFCSQVFTDRRSLGWESGRQPRSPLIFSGSPFSWKSGASVVESRKRGGAGGVCSCAAISGKAQKSPQCSFFLDENIVFALLHCQTFLNLLLRIRNHKRYYFFFTILALKVISIWSIKHLKK